MPWKPKPHLQKPRRREPETRPSANARGYDYRWQQFRITFLAEHPLCVDCEAKGIAAPATDVHHVAKLRDRPELKYEPDNLLALCSVCHDARTARGE